MKKDPNGDTPGSGTGAVQWCVIMAFGVAVILAILGWLQPLPPG